MNVTSPYAGCGKSFAARVAAAQASMTYVPVRLNGAMTTRDLILYLKAQLHDANQRDYGLGDSVFLHIDVADTAPERTQAQLFEMIIFGTLLDLVSGKNLILDARKTAIWVEMAGGSLSDRFPFIGWLPTKTEQATRDSFCADMDILQTGMGEDFDSTRHDGTVAKDSTEGSNAWVRLHYVCHALDIMDSTEGYVLRSSISVMLVSMYLFVFRHGPL